MTSVLLLKKLVRRFDRKEASAVHTHDGCGRVGLGDAAGVFVVALRIGLHAAELSQFTLGRISRWNKPAF